MRNVTVLCLLLLFAGTQGVFASNASSAGSFIVDIPTVQILIAPAYTGDGASVTMQQGWGSQDDVPQNTSGATPCIYDCTMTNTGFGLAVGFSARILDGGPIKNLNTAFGNALFRPPIV